MLGIDLGTTNSAVSVIAEGADGFAAQVMAPLDENGNKSVPSQMVKAGDQWYSGHECTRIIHSDPHAAIFRGVKMMFGETDETIKFLKEEDKIGMFQFEIGMEKYELVNGKSSCIPVYIGKTRLLCHCPCSATAHALPLPTTLHAATAHYSPCSATAHYSPCCHRPLTAPLHMFMFGAFPSRTPQAARGTTA